MKLVLTGKCSTFGGPNDTGVAPDEDLALYERKDVESAPKGLFLERQPEGTTGTARRLNPEAFYCAMRWAYNAKQRAENTGFGTCLPIVTPRKWLRENTVTVSANGKTFKAVPVDFGPNGRTRRIADLSPGLAKALGVSTDDEVTVTIEVA